MVSSAKMKKLQGRIDKSRPYEGKLNSVMMNLLGVVGRDFSDPLLSTIQNPARALVVEIVGNRGLCGGFNSAILREASELKLRLQREGLEVSTYVIGKKGMSFYSFKNIEVFKSVENPDDAVAFDDAARLGDELKGYFLSGEFHEIYVVYSKYISPTSQKPAVVKLFPVTPDVDLDADAIPSASTDCYFEPNPARIFSYILPLYIKVRIFTFLLETVFSENFARRVSMKNATDASNDMIRKLTLKYNRVRQAKITNEISEIVGGAAGLE